MSSYKRKRRLSDSRSKLPSNVQNDIQSLFEKKFSYKSGSGSGCYLNNCREIKLHDEWFINENMAMKNELNSLKNNLNDKDLLTWHDHTREVNRAGNIASEIRSRVRPELCTQAWCKFYEIASRYINLEKFESLFSVHLCEAPGAFITSLNHFLCTHEYPGNWQWLATTLNPYYEGNGIGHMIDEDRFIRGSHDNWYFGEDGTGDLMSEANLKGLQIRLSECEINLVTADGSIDCQGDPAEQENVVSRLQHCEVFTALHILSPGGTLIVKMFTMFECKAVSLMYLLNCVFEKVEVFKPCTSKGGNSEVYVIGLEYKGRESCSDLLKVMTPIYFGPAEPHGCLFSQADIHQLFLEQHSTCIEYFKDCQMTTIQRNLDLFKVMSDEERSRLEMEKDFCAECFFNTYMIKPLVSNARIMNLPKGRKSNQGRKTEFAVKTKLEGKFTGSFRERVELSTLSWQHKLKTFETYEDVVCLEDNSLWIKSPSGVMSESEICGLCTSLGKQVNTIHSSRFCDGFYLGKIQDIVQNVKWLSSPNKIDEKFVEKISTKLKDTLEATVQYYQSENSQYNTVETNKVHTSHYYTDCSNSALSVTSSKNGTDCFRPEDCKFDIKLDVNGKEKEKIKLHDDNSDTCSNDCGLSDVGSVEYKDYETCVNDCFEKNDVISDSNNSNVIDRKYESCDVSNICVSDVSMDCDKCNSRRSLIKYINYRSGSTVLDKLCTGGTGDAGVTVRLYSVVSDTVTSKFELDQQHQLLNIVTQILKSCETDDYVVIEMGSCLTRFMAGLVYILYKSFKEVGFIHHHGNLLNRHMICIGYLNPPIKLLQYLEHVGHMNEDNQSESVLEIVPVLTILNDSEFSTFLRISNVNLLQSFITTVVNKENLLLGDKLDGT